MVILDSMEQAIQRIERTDRPARMCELCLERIGDNLFAYEFDDGAVLYAEICWHCSDGHEEEIGIRLLNSMIFENEVKIDVINWLFDLDK